MHQNTIDDGMLIIGKTLADNAAKMLETINGLIDPDTRKKIAEYQKAYDTIIGMLTDMYSNGSLSKTIVSSDGSLTFKPNTDISRKQDIMGRSYSEAVLHNKDNAKLLQKYDAIRYEVDAFALRRAIESAKSAKSAEDFEELEKIQRMREDYYTKTTRLIVMDSKEFALDRKTALYIAACVEGGYPLSRIYEAGEGLKEAVARAEALAAAKAELRSEAKEDA